MIQIPNHGNDKSPDVVVIGAGIFGLWAARHALKRGERVLVLDKGRVGNGASGGFLGALMPHMPDNWNAKKQMQFDALSSLEQAVKHLEEDTGHDCGYRHCGRLMPLTHEKMPEIARRRIEGAQANWVDTSGKQLFHMELVQPEDLLTETFGGRGVKPWLSQEVASFGAVFDTLSARINPRAYLAALAMFVQNHQNGKIAENAEVVKIHIGGKKGHRSKEGVRVELRDGSAISPGRVVIANGWEAYSLLGTIDGRIDSQKLTGRGVKGQAVLLEHAHDDHLPIIYDNGSYIVPHADGEIAIGSTSVDDWMPLGLGGREPANPSVSIKIRADHPERPASVEPAQNREGFEDGPLPDFSEMPELARRSLKGGYSLSTESFVGDLSAKDPLTAKLIQASVRSFDHDDMGFYHHALALCPSLQGSPFIERWANIRPRNTVLDPVTGKIGTEPIFGALDGIDQVQVLLGGFKISLGIGHSIAI